MYQVLLVDDEALITDGLAEYLARRAPERFEILKAYSGAGALEIAGRMRVDILVTDIEMLGRDFSHRARQFRIRLSGHSGSARPLPPQIRRFRATCANSGANRRGTGRGAL